MSMAVADPSGAPITAPLAGSSPSAASGLSAEAPAGVLRTSPGGEKSSGSKRGVLGRVGRMSSSVNFNSQTSQQVSSTHLHLLRALSTHQLATFTFTMYITVLSRTRTRAAIRVDSALVSLLRPAPAIEKLRCEVFLPGRDSRWRVAMRLQENAFDEALEIR